MKVLIAGAGEVGFHLAERLSQEAQDVTLIEADAERAEYVSNHLDVMTVVGNGASIPVLEEAGVKDANVLLAVTSRDEANLISCLAGTRMGVDYTIARISNPEYYAEGSVLSREQMGIDLMINPERECAKETYELLASPAATDVARFAEGRVQLTGVKVREGAPVAGKTLGELGRELADFHFVTAAIVREGRTTIPNGQSRIDAGDQVFLLSPTSEADSIPALAGHPSTRPHRVMIAGGSAEGLYLAEILEENGISCTILDRDRRRCVELAEALPKALVLHADATDLELLQMEGVTGVDGFVAATGNDETNLLSSLLAKTLGARKVVSLIHHFEYLPLGPRVGIDATVSPRMSTVNAILRYVRQGSVANVATLMGIDAQVIEFTVTEEARVAGRTLADLHMHKTGVVGTVIRGDEIFLPRGNDRLLAGDEVIVFALPEAVSEIERLF